MKTIQIFILIVISLHSYAQFTDINPDKDVLQSNKNFDFTNYKHGYVLSFDTTRTVLLRTSNSGDTWQVMSYPWPVGEVYFINDSIGIMQGNPPKVTLDYGKTFKDISNPPPVNFSNPEIYIRSKIDVFLNYGTKEKVYKSSDYGNSWKKVHDGYLSSIHFINDLTGFSYGAIDDKPYIFTTSNRGDSWAVTFPSPYFTKVQFVDTLTAFGQWTYLLHTKDGGKIWDTSFAKTWVYDFQFINESVGFVYDESGFYKTIDGGNSWHKFADPVYANEMEVFYENSKFYFYVNLYNSSETSIYRGVFDSTEIWSSVPVKNIQATQFKIYPNPAKSEITISYTGFVKMGTTGNIYDVSGRNVKTFTMYNPNTVVNLKGLSKGVYILKIRTENNEFVERFVKE